MEGGPLDQAGARSRGLAVYAWPSTCPGSKTWQVDANLGTGDGRRATVGCEFST